MRKLIFKNLVLFIIYGAVQPTLCVGAEKNFDKDRYKTESKALEINSQDEIYDKEGFGFSSTRNKACEEALMYAKKEAMDSAGVIIRTSVQSNQSLKNDSFSKTDSMDFYQSGSGLVKVISKSEDFVVNKEGSHVCHVKARLSVNTKAALQHNRKFEGQLPEWTVSPPRILGKHTVIGYANTFDGAMAVALNRYAFLFNYRENIEPVTKLDSTLKEGEEVVTKNINTLDINPDIKIVGMYKTKMSYTSFEFSETVWIDFMGTKKKINFYRDQLQGGPSEELTEVAGDANYMDEFLKSLKRSQFIVEYEPVVSGDSKEWYVMIIGPKNTAPPAKLHKVLQIQE